MKRTLTLMFLAVTMGATAQDYVTTWHSDRSAEMTRRAAVDSVTFDHAAGSVTSWRNDGLADTRRLASVDSMTFTAPEGGVAVVTGAPVSVGATTMTAYNVATAAAVAERGVCWSATNAEPTTADQKLADAATTGGAWAAEVSGLTNGTTYHYRAYAVAGGRTWYGPVRTFTAGQAPATAKNTPVNLGLSVRWSSSNLEQPATASGKGLASYGLSPNKVYTVSTERGGWVGGYDGTFKSTKDAGTSVSQTDARQQFAFVPSAADSTVFYLYSVGQKKFVKADRSLSETNPDRVYIWNDTGDSNYPYFFSFTADKSNYNVNIGGANQMTVDKWNTYDKGNKCKLQEVSGTGYSLEAARAQIVDAGAFYAWGETVPKSGYLWSNYKYGTGLTRSKYTTTDGKETLEAADDAATATLGDGWRTPTAAEFQELCEQCQWVWEDAAGGFRVIGPNGNTIFLPAAGFKYGSTLYVNGDFGYYLTATRAAADDDAHYVGIFKDAGAWDYTTARFFGCSLRPVKK